MPVGFRAQVVDPVERQQETGRRRHRRGISRSSALELARRGATQRLPNPVGEFRPGIFQA